VSPVIGKGLKARFEVGRLEPAKAAASLGAELQAFARPLVEVRARGAEMIACLVLRADRATTKLCRGLGLDLRAGASAVFGLPGRDAARLFTLFDEEERAWLEAPSAARETKVLLLAGGAALLSIHAEGGQVTVTSTPWLGSARME